MEWDWWLLIGGTGLVLVGIIVGFNIGWSDGFEEGVASVSRLSLQQDDEAA